MPLSKGQQLAIEQLDEIANLSQGLLEILEDNRESLVNDYLIIKISLYTRAYRKSQGLALRDREKLNLFVGPDFPFSVPALHFAHKRFIGAPHVQWGRSICLYQSSDVEWNPAGGLFSFFDRVDLWFSAAGIGELDPNDAPLHPPAAYTRSATTFVIRANAPVVGVPEFWIGRADTYEIREDRFDVVSWTNLDDWDVSEQKESGVSGAIILSQPLAMEYPSKVNDLFDLLESKGVPFSLLFRLLRLLAAMAGSGVSAYLILGAPMRRKAAGEELKQHLTVWELSSDDLRKLIKIRIGEKNSDENISEISKWMTESKVQWCNVLEDRPEILIRRDTGSLICQLSSKKILLFGCGALGSAIAEYIVRGGAELLTVVDNGIVKPGILVRQKFQDADIGRNKAYSLRDDLNSIGLSCKVSAECTDLSEKALEKFDLGEWDLIIDATASQRVGQKIEVEISKNNLKVPLMIVSVSSASQFGSVAVKMPEYTGGPMQLNRQAKLEAFANNAEDPIVTAFWPDVEEMKIFQPEPGCSSPTFVGSAADLSHHASGLLNLGLSRLRSLESDRGSLDFLSAPWLEIDDIKHQLLKFDFEHYTNAIDRNHGFKVLFSQVANDQIAAELSRNARTRTSKFETGGLMFGEVDNSHSYVWIDSVSGPPIDSESSPERFYCGTAGTVELANFKKLASGGSSKFVGIWHTHPVSVGIPSQEDLSAMAELLFLQALPPRQVVMLIVGFAESNPTFNYYLFHRNDFRKVKLSLGI